MADDSVPVSERLIDCFDDRVERDELISPLLPGGVSGGHRQHVQAPVPHWGWGVAPQYRG